MKQQTGEENVELYANNEADIISLRRKLFEILFVIAGGVLTALAYPDVNWDFCGWIGVIPLILVIKDKRARCGWLYGLIWGISFCLIAFFWIREIEPFIPFIMAPVLAVFPAFWAMAVPFFYRYLIIPVDIQLRGEEYEKDFLEYNIFKGILFTFSLAALWCLTEWVRSWIFTGFPWNFLAVTQWKNLPLIQICEYTGIYGVSFIIAAINISGAFAIDCLYKGLKQGKYIRPVPFMAALILLMISVLTGYKLAGNYKKNSGGAFLRAAVIQGNIPQCRQATEEQTVFAIKQYIELSELAVKLKPDVVIWPETAVPVPLLSSDAMSSVYRFKLLNLIRKCGIPFLIGSLDFGQKISPLQKQYPLYNSALFIGKDCTVKGRYNKTHLVPFGEYVPFSRYFPRLQEWIGMGRDLTEGKRFNYIEIKPDVRAGMEICFEDIFPYISVNHAYNGANILIVLSNDAWYPTSYEPVQHLANSVFRTVETRLPMIRAGNNCCSVLIDRTGEIIDAVSAATNPKTNKIELFPCKKSRGFALFTVKLEKKPELTFFTKYPYVFILICTVLFFSGLLLAVLAWKDKKSGLAGE